MPSDVTPLSRWMDQHRARMELGPLSILIRKLLSHSLLSTADQEAIAALPHKIKTLPQGGSILREGDQAEICPILLSGFAYRQKVASDGGRQIVALKLPGDALDLQSLYLQKADHDVRMLTPAELALVPLAAIEQLTIARPGVARAILIDILIESSISREWLLNIGRRNALARLAHLLCELHDRVSDIASETSDHFEIPLTQEQLADLLGLTPVHINRMVRQLEKMGAIGRPSRSLTILNFAELAKISSFSSAYLHRSNASRV
ncbi:Crp/Fnr family transcriptional regulator [Sphingopyxis sp.]|uniref:Crp/Fnr family transcriptional regulator n=1 Tax=Sphingopyxis sp. TaxID=1908224 RepID=UPI002ED90255